jgi:hypothetical protein
MQQLRLLHGRGDNGGVEAGDLLGDGAGELALRVRLRRRIGDGRQACDALGQLAHQLDGVVRRLGRGLRLRLLDVEHLLGDRASECEPRRPALLDQDLAQTAAGALLFPQRSLEVDLGDLPCFDQDLTDRTPPHGVVIGS